MGARLEPDAVERVVRRAIEIESDAEPDGVDVVALVEAASEAGIDTDAVLEAIAWERLGPAPSRARLDRMVGGSTVVVDRLLRAPVVDVVDQVDRWLTVGHHLRREVANRLPFGDVDGAAVEWAKREDLAASVQRSVRSVAGGAGLGSVRRVSARVVPIDTRRSIARLVIDRRRSRSATLATSGGVGTASVAGGAVAATAVATPLIVVAAPGLIVAGGAAVASRRRAGSLERELRRLLDQVDSGERPATIVGGVAQRLGLRRA